MKEILEILNKNDKISRDSYKKLKKLLTPENLNKIVFEKFTLLDYIMLKDFDSEYDRRKFIQYIFSLEEINPNKKLNIYLNVLVLGVNSCLINESREYDSDFCSVAYLKVGNNFDKQLFRESRDLALLASRFIPYLATKHQKGFDAKAKTIAKKIVLNGLISENYLQVIDKNSSKRGIEEIVKYLARSENFGTIIKIFEDKIFEVNEDNYKMILDTLIIEGKNGQKGYDTRYSEKQVNDFIVKIGNILDTCLDECKNKIK